MANLFLDQYSLSGCFCFEGFFKHKEAFYKEKEWNGYAVAHFILAFSQMIPGISQMCYFLEGLTFSLFFESAKPLDPTQVKLKQGTVFGTKNQYTGFLVEKCRQSCSVQAITFLKYALKNPTFDTSMIDSCIEESHQTFQKLSENAQEARREQARDYLIKQGLPEEDVDDFLRENPGVPKIGALRDFLFGRDELFDASFQLLSGHALNVKEALKAFESDLEVTSDIFQPLQKQGSFASIFPENGNGKILTCNGLTLAIATLDNTYLVYDSHGNTAKHTGNSAAFIEIANSSTEAEAFLASVFDYREGGTNQLEIATVKPILP